MLFGPTGAPGYFQYFMQDVLIGQIWRDIAAYPDDIMVYTEQGASQEDVVNSVLEILSQHCLWLNT
jgi:hypothetical protein